MFDDPPPTPCAQCRKAFQKTRPWQRYCGPACRRQKYLARRRAKRKAKARMRGDPRRLHCRCPIDTSHIVRPRAEIMFIYKRRRADVRYCNEACRQAAYRKRKKG